MNNLKQLVCPVSRERVNERVVRLNAFFGVLFIISSFLLNTPFFAMVLTADFYIRAFTRLKFSPISFLSNQLIEALQLEKKAIDKAPKIFAARIGFIMSLLVTVFILTGLTTAALITGGILVFFAMLEFALAVCMGCIMYTYLVLPFYK